MSDNYQDQNQTNQEYQQTQQEVSQEQMTTDQAAQDYYYGGQSMDYSATQIENYEEGYDANAYANYYDQYMQASPAQTSMMDAQMHKEQYAYFVEHKEEVRQYFPKKRKIVRWEDAGTAYNSLEAAEEFMDLLQQMQDEQATQTQSQKNEYDDIE